MGRSPGFVQLANEEHKNPVRISYQIGVLYNRPEIKTFSSLLVVS